MIEAGGGRKESEVFKDCRASAGGKPLCGPEMVVVPSGYFDMGSTKEEIDALHEKDPKLPWDIEGPQHKVTITQPFAVARFTISREQFEKFVQVTSYGIRDSCRVYKDGEWKDAKSKSWRDPGFSQSDNHPAVCISWNMAQAYAAWLSQEMGKEYRLLTEAEREYVSRAGTRTPFWWGRSITTDQANYYGNVTFDNGPRGKWRQTTVPVESFEPNPWGVYQVHGNVWE
jgi:formylglycine-generating enzyme required for sulfatase activity